MFESLLSGQNYLGRPRPPVCTGLCTGCSALTTSLALPGPLPGMLPVGHFISFKACDRVTWAPPVLRTLPPASPETLPPAHPAAGPLSRRSRSAVSPSASLLPTPSPLRCECAGETTEELGTRAARRTWQGCLSCGPCMARLRAP